MDGPRGADDHRVIHRAPLAGDVPEAAARLQEVVVPRRVARSVVDARLGYEAVEVKGSDAVALEDALGAAGGLREAFKSTLEVPPTKSRKSKLWRLQKKSLVLLV